MFVVMNLQKWEEMEARGLPYDIRGPEGTVGCLLVYETLSDAKREWPNHEAIKVEFVNPYAQSNNDKGDV